MPYSTGMRSNTLLCKHLLENRICVHTTSMLTVWANIYHTCPLNKTVYRKSQSWTVYLRLHWPVPVIQTSHSGICHNSSRRKNISTRMWHNWRWNVNFERGLFKQTSALVMNGLPGQWNRLRGLKVWFWVYIHTEIESTANRHWLAVEVCLATLLVTRTMAHDQLVPQGLWSC